MEINLLSDTITRPTNGMLVTMFNAEVGDDVFKADPTVNQLQKKGAAMFGKEDALFFPSGTMANQVAIKLHTQPGEQLICDKWAHVYNYEGGGASFNSGVSCKLLDGTRGMFTAQQVAENVSNKSDIHQALRSIFKERKDLDPILLVLVDHGYLIPIEKVSDTRPGRKPSPIFYVNPELFTHNTQITQKEAVI